MGCSEKEILLQGENMPLKNGQFKYERKTIYAVNDTVITEDVNSGFSPSLLLGHYQNFTTKILLKFENLPDSSVINSAVLSLYTRGNIGDPQPFQCSIHEITSEWQEDMNSYQNPGADPLVGFGLESIGDYIPSLSESSVDSLSLDRQIVEKWSFSYASNNGIAIISDNANYIKEYHSNETSETPKLTVNFVDNGRDTTAVFEATKGLFIIEGEISGENGFNIISTGTGQRIGIKFNLEEIPEYATIIQANLSLQILSDESMSGSLQNDSLKVLLFDSTWSLIPHYYQTAVTKDGEINDNKFETDITVFVQSWTSKKINNNGIAVQALKEGTDISYFAVFSTESFQEEVKPKLDILYGLPPLIFLKSNENE